MVAMLLGCRDSRPPLRIGLNDWVGCGYLFVAEEQGWLSAAGMRVKFVELATLSDVVRAFEIGQVDVMCVSIAELMRVHDSAHAPRAFYVVDVSSGADVVLAREPIRAVAGLRGKRVAAEPGTLTTLLLARALETASLRLGDVTLVASDQARVVSQFQAGEVDAAVTFPPRSSQLERLGEVNRVFSSADVLGEIADVLVATDEIFAQRSDELDILVHGMYRALEFSKREPTLSREVMARRLDMSASEIAVHLDGPITPVALAQQCEMLAPDGVLAQSLRRSAMLFGIASASEASSLGASLLDCSAVKRVLDDLASAGRDVRLGVR